MSIKQFKFVSPGVFINEIDNSFLPNITDQVGPVIIGRTERGPALTPIKVESFSQYINVFGNPIPGGFGRDVWRYGNYTAPTYAAYAAQAWLRNSTPATIVRLLGAEDPNATAAGKAGWVTTNQYNGTHGGGAYGLFLFPSASNGVITGNPLTGTIGAIWYMNRGTISLSGSTVVTPGAPVASQSYGDSYLGTTNYGFKAVVNDGASDVYSTEFNFDPSSEKFIRKVFNTNPTLTNSNIGIAASTSSYWLGETYENWLGNTTQTEHHVTSSSTAYYGVIVPMRNATTTSDAADNQVQVAPAQTDWIFSQDLSDQTASFSVNNMQQLFKFHTLNEGLWEPQNLKIAIEDVRAGVSTSDPYGSFTVTVRSAKDTDSAIKYIERFPECNLNPNSVNYIAKKIGDISKTWNYEEGRYTEVGNYTNRSKFVRVEMNVQIEANQTNEEYLPWGFRGPTKFASFCSLSGNGEPRTLISAGANYAGPVTGSQQMAYPGSNSSTAVFMGFGGRNGAAQTFVWPGVQPRFNSLSAPGASKAYWGASTNVHNAGGTFDYNWYEYVRALPLAWAGTTAQFVDGDPSAPLTRSFTFTLDDLSASHGSNFVSGPGEDVSAQVSTMYWNEGNRTAGTSYRGTGDYREILKRGFDKFIVPLYGGADGLDVREMEPFRNSGLTGKNQTTSYAYNSIKRAIESVSDPEVVDCNMITMPGLTNSGLNTEILRTCESRADSLAILDLAGGYQPNTETVGTEGSRLGTLDAVVTTLRDMQENTSYACTYYPWIQIKDPQNGAQFWAPPSIAALGVMANTEKQAELWFAPAGFNRGGLTIGAAGIPVTNVRQKLTSKDRDKLYEANINPIASFPNEGLVVFGQKTLQVTPSALDRINVRRLMNYIKKEISKMASNILFDQNIPVTWNRFLSRVNPFLASVKARFGLQDFKVVLDGTTTTPEMIDRNIMYAKIFLKPTRAIEFIAIDFNITNTGAAFAD